VFGLTLVAVLHAAISLIAVAAGLIAGDRYQQISATNLVGKMYVAKHPQQA
jgi:hypothetical protein